MTLPRYKHYNEARAPKRFWLYVWVGAFVLFILIPLLRPSVRAWWAWLLGL